MAVLLSMIFNPGPRGGPPGPEKRLRRVQGLVYGELQGLGDGRKQAAQLVGLGPKAIDWARNHAMSIPGPDVDVLVELRELLGPVVDLYARISAGRPTAP